MKNTFFLSLSRRLLAYIAYVFILALGGCVREQASVTDFVDFNGKRLSIDSFTVERQPLSDSSARQIRFVMLHKDQEVAMVQFVLTDVPPTYPIDGAPVGVYYANVCIFSGCNSFSCGGSQSQICTGGSEVLRALKPDKSPEGDEILEIDWRGTMGSQELSGGEVSSGISFSSRRVARR